MLVLTRKLGESIRIGDTITVRIVDLDNRHVKLGIEAPKNIAVNREEIYERIQRENKAASVARETGINKIALSGGVFQNRLLFELAVKRLEAKSMTVLMHKDVPVNDGGIALGQAVIANVIGREAQGTG